MFALLTIHHVYQHFPSFKIVLTSNCIFVKYKDKPLLCSYITPFIHCSIHVYFDFYVEILFLISLLQICIPFTTYNIFFDILYKYNMILTYNT